MTTTTTRSSDIVIETDRAGFFDGCSVYHYLRTVHDLAREARAAETTDARIRREIREERRVAANTTTEGE